MAENTKIQWTDHSINFWTGCKKVSDGCKYCYMYRDKERYGRDPSDVVQVREATIKKVLKVAKPGDKIFTCSWSDFFIEEADDWREWAWDIIRSRPDLHWQILTKRPERIKECLPNDWGDGWNNVWLGVSVENQKTANERLPILSNLDAKMKFISIEPILDKINLSKVMWFSKNLNAHFHVFSAFDWVIIGGESGNEKGKYRYRPSEIEWYINLVEECKLNRVPVFVKQLGTYLSKRFALSDRHGGDIKEFPEGLQIRLFPNLNN